MHPAMQFILAGIARGGRKDMCSCSRQGNELSLAERNCLLRPARTRSRTLNFSCPPALANMWSADEVTFAGAGS